MAPAAPTVRREHRGRVTRLVLNPRYSPMTQAQQQQPGPSAQAQPAPAPPAVAPLTRNNGFPFTIVGSASGSSAAPPQQQQSGPSAQPHPFGATVSTPVPAPAAKPPRNGVIPFNMGGNAVSSSSAAAPQLQAGPPAQAQASLVTTSSRGPPPPTVAPLTRNNGISFTMISNAPNSFNVPSQQQLQGPSARTQEAPVPAATSAPAAASGPMQKSIPAALPSTTATSTAIVPPQPVYLPALTAPLPLQVPQLAPPLAPQQLQYEANPPSQHLEPLAARIYLTPEIICRFAADHPLEFEMLVGLYFQESWRGPCEVFNQPTGPSERRVWIKSPRWADLIVTAPQEVDRWQEPQSELYFRTVRELLQNQAVFEETICLWAREDERITRGRNVDRVVRRAGWTTLGDIRSCEDYSIMDQILKMPEGEEKTKRLGRAKEESPAFFHHCLDDLLCGWWVFKLFTLARNFSEANLFSSWDYECVNKDDYEFDRIAVYYTREGQHTRVLNPRSPKAKPDYSKMSGGQPMQVHNVPEEERAYDSTGKRLPWALEWPEYVKDSLQPSLQLPSMSLINSHSGHPNARGQKRHVEEKGPFGKSNKRKGSSRTRTATPAKKENPTLDSFDRAYASDVKNYPTAFTPPHPKKLAPETLASQPTEVLIYGYPTSRQWQALSKYENLARGGFILEDYPRESDESLRRYQNPISHSPNHQRPRKLTREERQTMFRAAMGAHWVKVTFNSAEAAEGALWNSPIRVQNHWVYAQPYYQGMEPQLDEPIPLTAEEIEAKQPLSNHKAVYGPAASTTTVQSTTAATTTSTTTTTSQDSAEGGATTSATTAMNQNANALRRRPQHNPAFAVPLDYIPPLPAHLALLPTPTFWERSSRWLAQYGIVMPGEMIGNGIPRFDDGAPNWPQASFYWKVMGWIDNVAGTDLCGLREDEEEEL